ncbi:PspA/IM30 family protein [Xanthomonas campestris]|uniref:PspA/IM30 family protein n=1 Tax=Xanthomonas campestris TaxID=339 RepID=UPI00388D51B4
MSIFSKLITLLRGTAHETGQKAVDANALRILDQEMRDAGAQLTRSREELTKLMAQSKLAQQKIDARAGKMAEYTRYIEGALAKNDEALAHDVAVKLAALESEDAGDKASKTALDQSVVTLKATIQKTENQLRGMRQQIDTVKATDAVQKAQAAIAARHSGASSKMGSALESLERIKARQAETSARIESAEELESSTGDGDLNRRLAAAGLMEGESNAAAVLARFKKPAARLGHDTASGTAPLIGQVRDVQQVPRSDS